MENGKKLWCGVNFYAVTLISILKVVDFFNGLTTAYIRSKLNIRIQIIIEREMRKMRENREFFISCN